MEEEEEAQLKRMESGSLLAICAMCFSMSFLVMIPSSLLKNKKTETKESHITSSHTLFASSCKKSDGVTESGGTHTGWRPGFSSSARR